MILWYHFGPIFQTLPYNSSGIIDASWGQNGSTTYSCSDVIGDDQIMQIVMDRERNIYAAGQYGINAKDWRIAKYSGGGSLSDMPLTVSQNQSYALTSQSEQFRLRMLFHIGTNKYFAGSPAFKLRYAEKGADCENASYSDVTNATPIAFYNNTNLSDGDRAGATTTDPTHGTDTIIHQTYEEQNNFTATSTIEIGQDGLWDFSLVDFGGTSNTTYCFKVTDSDGNDIYGYTVYPEITTYDSSGGGGGAGTTTQRFQMDGNFGIEGAVNFE